MKVILKCDVRLLGKLVASAGDAVKIVGEAGDRKALVKLNSGILASVFLSNLQVPRDSILD